MEIIDRPYWTLRLFKASTQRWPMRGAPNAFHRFMQRLVLGVIWERIE